MNKQKHIYIIGIGGKGLNSIAEFCILNGYQVSGSDIKKTKEIEKLERIGVHVYVNQDGTHVTVNHDIVLYSSIIPTNHPERIRATQLGITQMERAKFLNQLTQEYIRISVAGSHGKSTTSALATLAIKAETNHVNAITGAYIKELDSYQTTGDSPYCVLEACEYAKSFFHIPGDYTIITSLEKSHMEYFKNEDLMNQAFSEFIGLHKSNSSIIINGDIPILRLLCTRHLGPVITCGFEPSNDYVIQDVRFTQSGSIFSLYKNSICIEKDIYIKIPGEYNILNVAFVFVLLYQLGLSTHEYKKVLLKFTGVGRRFELEKKDSTVFIDDFAHHPTQVRNLFASIKQFFPHKKIFAIFEPRQFHLFKTFLKEYGSSFMWADEVYITDIIPALGDTQTDIQSLTTHDVIKSVQVYSKPKQVWYAPSYQDIVKRLQMRDLSDTVIATIGAGAIYKVKDLLIQNTQL
jgi:UDP-N-acetylmuramate--alanine ligase